MNVGQESVSLAIASDHEEQTQNSVSASYGNSTTEEPPNKHCGIFGKAFFQPNDNCEQIPPPIENNNTDEELEMNVGHESVPLANPSHHEDEPEDSVPASYVHSTTEEPPNKHCGVFQPPNDNHEQTQHTIKNNNTAEG